MNEQFARHLRANRQVAIDLHRTVIPDGWVPHPTTARKVGLKDNYRAYAKAIARWKRELHVSTNTDAHRTAYFTT